MKPSTSQLQTLIKTGSTVQAVPKLIAEWEHNRFSPFAPITVTPAQDTDLEWSTTYDLQSIANPNRPDSGIAKTRFSSKLIAASSFKDSPASSRFYIPTQTDPYRYFSSTQKSAGTVTSGEYVFSTPIVLTLIYTNPVVANKLVVGFEQSYAKPKRFTIETTTNGTTWTGIGGSFGPDAAGKVTLWRGSGGTWSDVPQYDGDAALKGIRLTVNSMDTANSHLDVIQMGLRLEDDLSDFIESYDKSMEISDRSMIAPVGRASANTANVTLNNIDGRFNNENQASLYFGLLAKKVRFKLDLSFDATSAGGSSDERIRELTMWTDTWGGGEETSVTVGLVDSSVILQETPTPRVFWTDNTFGAVVWQMMDMVGLTNYNYTKDVADSGQLVPYFYPETGKMVWETLSELSEGTQNAIFFDEYDVLQIKTRKALFTTGKAINWNLDAIQNGQKLPDVVDALHESDTVVNKVDIVYKPAHYSDYANGFPKMETAWEPPDDAVTLRSSALVKDFHLADTAFYIRYTDALVWDFNGTVDIRGELISYTGKEYAWHGTDGAMHYDICKSLDDQKALDAKSDKNLAWSNQYTGKMIVDKRGINGSVATDHLIRPAAYTGTITNYENTVFQPVNGGAGMTVNNGVLSLSPPLTLGEHTYFKIQPEAVVNSINTTYGIRFRFPTTQSNGSQWTCGGMFVAGDWGDTGYYLEVSTTETIDSIENRVWRNELNLVAMPGDSTAYQVGLDDISSGGSRTIKGLSAAIVPGQWYDLDIRHTKDAGANDIITAYLDGVLMGSWWNPHTNRQVPDQGKFGAFLRGMCNMDIEYMYAVNNDPSADAIDQATFLDIVDGGYASGYIGRQWRYGPQWQSTYYGSAREGSHRFDALNNRANYFLDEYGPVVHEVREFDVTFDDQHTPVSHSYLYLSNSSKAICTDYWADPFGARFTLANTSRENAILKGDDDSLGENNTIHQQMFIYGRSLYQDNESTITKTDDQSVRANGVIGLTVDSRFVETDVAANDIGQWVLDQWAAGSDELTVNVFGNPLLQLGDLVTMDYPVRGMYPTTHKYWVVAISNSFTQGLETKLTLRRARNS